MLYENWISDTFSRTHRLLIDCANEEILLLFIMISKIKVCKLAWIIFVLLIDQVERQRKNI